MRHRGWAVGVLLGVLALAPGQAAAQMNSMITGRVVDAKGQPVEKAQVVIEFLGGLGRKYEILTGADGGFAQMGLASGPYRITVRKEGIGSSSDELTVGSGARVSIDVNLNPVPVAESASPAGKAFQAGLAASKAGNDQEAVARFKEAVGLDPKCFDCQYNLGAASLAIKDYTQAEAALKEAAALRPDNPAPLEALAGVYNAQRRFEDAAKAGEQASKLRGQDPAGGGNAAAVFDQGLILWNAGKIDEARARFEETLKLDPGHAEVHYWLGMANLNQGKLPEAASEMDLYLKADPNGRFVKEAKGLLSQLKP